MRNIVPRWEWRAFGDDFGEADERFAQMQPENVAESDEIYFLSPATDANVKVRDALMDVKTLQQVNGDGLEQWEPIMKESFPLSSADAKKVFELLKVIPSGVTRPEYTLQQFTGELAEPHELLQVVLLHKKRARYTVGGCMSEMTDVSAKGRHTRTVAFELEDPARVIATVRDLKLDRFANTNYPRGLKELLGIKF